MAVDTHKRLMECFQRGNHLAHVEKNHDYAHTMFAECLTHEPGNLQFAEALIQNLRAKYGGCSKGSRHLFALPSERDFKKAIGEQNWADGLRLGLTVLQADPWHVATLRGMASACQALHLNEVELVYLKQALEAAPKSVEVNRHCAQSLARMGQFDQAIACWHRIEEITGGNGEAAKMISQLAEDKIHFANAHPEDLAARRRQSESEVATQAALEAEDAGAEEEQNVTGQAVVFNPQQRLERALEADPADVTNYLKLAELLCESGYYEKAFYLLTRAARNCAQVGLIQDAQAKVLTLQQAAANEAAEIERQKKLRAERKPFRVPWLELMLGIAGVVLVFQIFPNWWQAVWNAIFDHTRVALFTLNVIVLAVLILWRQWKR